VRTLAPHLKDPFDNTGREEIMSLKRWLAGLGICLFAATTAWAAPPHKALIVDGQNNHNWQETTPVLQSLLEETGLFSVDVATSPAKGQDMSGFQPKFADYDVVVSNYTGDEWPEATKKALVQYVSGGGGLVIYHAANNAFPNWSEYNEMIAIGGWGGRNEKSGPYLYWKDGEIVRDKKPGRGGGHGPQHPFQIVVREPDHPITRGLPEVFMHSADELYSWLRGPAKNVAVLATAYSDPEKKGSGEHEPMLMTISYGQGRVFHTALGHAGQQCRSVAFITTFLRGTEWAATGKVTLPVPDDFPGPDAPSVRE
jgi:type 1 glutamine amidotransferase